MSSLGQGSGFVHTHVRLKLSLVQIYILYLFYLLRKDAFGLEKLSPSLDNGPQHFPEGSPGTKITSDGIGGIPLRSLNGLALPIFGLYQP